MTLNQNKVNQLIRDNLPMPNNIRKIDADVTVRNNYSHGETWLAIESITGDLHLSQNTKADFCSLINITGDLHLNQNTKADFSALVSISGYLGLRGNAQVNLSALTSVGNGIYISDYTEPLPTQLRHLETRDNFKLIYQAEAIANQVSASSEVSVIKRRTGV